MSNKSVSELTDDFIKRYDAAAKDAVWQQQSAAFRNFWTTRVMAPGAEALSDEECDSVIQMLDRNGKGNTNETEAVARAMVPQGVWRKMLNEFRTNRQLGDLVYSILEETSPDKKADLIDQLYKENKLRKNSLTGPSGNVICSFLAAYDPVNNLSVISLKDRKVLCEFLDLPVPFDWSTASMGQLIVRSNIILLDGLRACGFEPSASARTVTVFCYWDEMRSLWKDGHAQKSDGIEAAKKDDGYAPPFDSLFSPGGADPILDVFAKALEIIADELPNYEQMLCFRYVSRGKAFAELVIYLGSWPSLIFRNKANNEQLIVLLPAGHPDVLVRGHEREAKDETKAHDPYWEEYSTAEFFERYDELWPDIDKELRVICRRFAAWKGSQFMRFHRAELIALAADLVERQRILREGLTNQPSSKPPKTSRRYWMIAPGESAKYWDRWTEQNIAAIGWNEIGDLAAYGTKDEMQVALEEEFPERDQAGAALMLWNFCHVMEEGDVVFAKLGRTEVIGWGIVRGTFSYDAGQDDQPNLLPVEWEEKKAIKLPEGRMLTIKSLTEITGDQELLKILAKSYSGVPGLETDPVVLPVVVDFPPYRIEDALAELFMSRETLEHILEQLRRKKNIILQGAPGVGKTFIAKRLAWLLLEAKDPSAVEIVQFHQSYTYEDFVQGLRPTKDGHFAVKDGVFYRLCRKALANPQQQFFLIIDEINRGNLSKILGELMMLIETDKRGETLTLAYSEEPFTVPPNLYLIGTMNTADRSLSLVDYALRRRFAFLTLDPGFGEKAFAAHLGGHGLSTAQINYIRSQIATLNQEIENDEANLGKGYRIGHSFFTPTATVANFPKWWQSIVRYEIMPLLEEYWIDDPKMVQQFRLTLTEGLP